MRESNSKYREEREDCGGCLGDGEGFGVSVVHRHQRVLDLDHAGVVRGHAYDDYERYEK